MTTGSKLLDAAMALLQAAPDGELQVTNLNKALFYVDLVALRDSGRTLTGATYLGMDQGPTVADFQRKLVKRLVKAGWAEQVEQGMAKPLRVLKQIDPSEVFTPDEVDLLSDMAKAVAKQTATWLSDLSHENVGWQIAHERGRQVGNGAAAPIDMRIALQQLPDDDGDASPWIKAPLTKQETNLVNERTRATAKPW